MSDGQSHGIDHTRMIKNIKVTHPDPMDNFKATGRTSSKEGPTSGMPTPGETQEKWIHYHLVRKQMMVLKYYDHNSRSYENVFSTESELQAFLHEEMRQDRLKYNVYTNCYNEPDIIGLIFRLRQDPTNVG